MPGNAQRIVNGTYGSVWVNDELWAEVDSFEAKVTVEYEDIKFAGDGATYQKATGWKGEGSIKVKKIYSRVQRAMADSIRKGVYPRFKIVGKVADPDAFGSERVAIYDVTIGEMQLMKFENKTLGSEEIPFAFSDFEMIDTIQA